MMERRSNLLRLLAILGVLGITLYFAVFERFSAPGLPEALRGKGDHHLHALAFFCLTVIVLIGRRSFVRWATLVLAVALLAVTLETLQIWLPERGANVADLLASLSGVGLGAAVMGLFHAFSRRPWRQHR